MTKKINHIHELPVNMSLDEIIRLNWWISGPVLAYMVHPLALETTRVELEMQLDERDMKTARLEDDLYEARTVITRLQRELDVCLSLMNDSNEEFEAKMEDMLDDY